MNRFLHILLVLACCLGISSCASYKLGHEGQTQFASISIAPVRNASFAPQIAPLLSRSLAQTLTTHGGLKLSSDDQGEALLSVVVVEYDRKTTTSRSDDTGRGLGTRLTLRASVTLINQKTDEIYFKDRIFEAEATAYDIAGGTLTDAEYATMPNLSDELSRKIIDAVTSSW